MLSIATHPVHSIYQLERNVHQQSGGDAESQPLIRNADPTIVFSRALDVELEKICSFYSVKEKELIDEVQRVVRDVGTFESGEGSSTAGDVVEGGQVDRGDADTLVATTQQSRGGSPVSPASSDDGADDSDQDGDETAALNRPSRRRRSTEAVTYRKSHLTQGLTDPTSSSVVTRSRRYSTTYEDYSERDLMFSSNIMLKKRIIGLYVQLCELKSYVQLNRTGFSKVLKKFDKIVNRQLRSQYMDASVETAVVFRAESRQALEENIALMEKAYTSIVSGGDEAAAKRDLRSHLREHVVWERNTVWRDLIGMERRAEAASLGHTLLGRDPEPNKTRRQGDDERLPLAKVIATPIGRFRCPAWLVNSTMLTLVILTALFLAMISIPFMKAPEQQSCLAVVVFVSLLWATEVSVSLEKVDSECGAASLTFMTGHPSFRDVASHSLPGRPFEGGQGRKGWTYSPTRLERCGRLCVLRHVEPGHHAVARRLHARGGAVQTRHRQADRDFCPQ